MLYEIREQNDKFRLFFSKKKGLKFKKEFTSLRSVNLFVANYLRNCCIKCKENEWAYKTQLPKNFRGTHTHYGRQLPPAGTLAICPECKTKHVVQYENVELSYNNGKTIIPWKRTLLILSTD